MSILTSRLLTDRANDKRIVIDVPGDYLHDPNVVAKEVIDEIISFGGLVLYENHLVNRSIPFSVDLTLKLVISIVEAKYFRQESVQTNTFEEDPEPIPCSIDAWARNQVRVIVKPKQTIPEPLNRTQFDSKSVKTLKSRRSTSRSLNKTNNASKTNKSIIDHATINEEVSPIPQHIVEIDYDVEELRKRKEFEVQKRRNEREREKSFKKIDQELSKKLEKEAELLKDKQITFDYTGKVIIVTKPELGDIFEMNTPVRFSSLEPISESKSQKIIKKQTHHLTVMKKPARTQAEEKLWVKNMLIRASPLLENIELSPNVTLHDGPKTKLPPNDKNLQMTRKHYFSTTNNAKKSTKKSSSVCSGNSNIKITNDEKDFFENIPDYENANFIQTEHSRFVKSISPISRVPHGRVVNYLSDKNLVPASPQDYFNLEILNTQLWGINPPLKTPKVIQRKPVKIGPNEMREIFGNIVKKPKDHPFMTPEELWKNKSEIIKKPKDRPYIDKVVRRKKNPAPPYGQTMLNGFID